ncbi:MAG: hypothetical protein KatS3mg014_1506 [Actinomycetota bacterium]|nr:MAG: hypothetical protein KatS3mg014_1506 [Actinomycetota bacterium]
MNQESLDRANAFLAAIAARVQPGELLDVAPADVARQIGIAEPLVAARAVRALLARRRLEAQDGRYRLLDATPIQPGEKEQVPRPRRARTKVRRAVRHEAPTDQRPTYSEIGREAIDRLVELGREVATLRASLRSAMEEAREAREARDEAERRARTLAERVRELEGRAEMAEANLRTLLAAAKGAGRDRLGDTEMEAILGVLKGGEGAPSQRSEEPHAGDLA